MIKIDSSDLKEVGRKIKRLGARVGIGAARRSLIRDVRKAVVDQTTHRIITTKTSPNGGPWKDWSPEYAKTRSPGKHSLLRDTENLLLGVQGSIVGDTVNIFSDVPYAGNVQAERPFLGLSDFDVLEIRGILGTWLDKQVQVVT